jgi:hypothetical protein
MAVKGLKGEVFELKKENEINDRLPENTEAHGAALL